MQLQATTSRYVLLHALQRVITTAQRLNNVSAQRNDNERDRGNARCLSLTERIVPFTILIDFDSFTSGIARSIHSDSQPRVASRIERLGHEGTATL